MNGLMKHAFTALTLALLIQPASADVSPKFYPAWGRVRS
jgi:hypothetical protein